MELDREIAARFGVSGLSPIVDRRRGLIHRVIWAGFRDDGRKCVVKWSDNDAGSVENEYEIGRAYYSASGGLCPEMFDRGSVAGGLACAMEFMDGTLLSEIDAQGCDPSRAKAIADGIDKVFAAMSRIGMCHRDCAAGNIMVMDNGMVKLFDFQMSVLASQKRDPLSRAISASRSFIYKFRSRHQPVIGLFNDKEHLLLSLRPDGAIRNALSEKWSGAVGGGDYFSPVGTWHAARFVTRSLGVAVLRLFAFGDGKAARKVRMKASVILPTFKYWLNRGFRPQRGFVKGRA